MRMVCALIALITAAVVGCDQTDRVRATQSDVGGAGRILYLTHCESCHGVAGAGDGRAAGSLRTPPANLTRLWERYGTPLDRERLAEYVDGRLLMFFHGAREMPIWGEEFFEDVPSGTPGLEATKRRLIEVLVEYLETLQTKQQT
jgi:mono/diheme cytochrome c family protein